MDAPGRKIRVMIIDDSMLIRQVLQKELAKDPEIEVVAVAGNPVEARPLVERYQPDVLTMDVEMPKMDGLTFLDILQRSHPVPVIMLSTLTAQGSALAVEALRRGAVEVMLKPGGGSFLALNRAVEELIFKIKAAAVARKQVFAAPTAPPSRPPPTPALRNIVIAIGASTGGTEALRYILSQLPANLPPIVIVQHMPEAFTGPFAAAVNTLSQLTVQECGSTMALRPGLALLARGGRHLSVIRKTSGYLAVSQPGDPVCHQCPSVEVLFNSVAQVATDHSIGVILTGMGADGAKGLLAMRHAGAITIAQNEATCAVFGMPKEAIALGAAQQILPLERIPAAIVEAVRTKGGLTPVSANIRERV